jgi:hypothetical protein
MPRTSFGLALASLLVVSGGAFADQMYFVSPGTTTWNGVYVNPYLANDNTQPANNPLTIYCDDWNTEFSGNPTWNADIYALTASNVSNFKYGNTTSNYNVTLNNNQLSAASSSIPTPFNRYLEAAWLDDQFSNSSSTDTQIEIAAAEWLLFVDSAHVGGLVSGINSSGYATAVYDDLQAAQNAVTTGGYLAPGWDVIVPVGNSFAMQEFLVKGLSGGTGPLGPTNGTVPEPSAVILLGTVAGFFVTRLRGKHQAANLGGVR